MLSEFWKNGVIAGVATELGQNIQVLQSQSLCCRLQERLTLKFLTDDECLKIEKQIMNLHDDDLLQYQVLMALYIQQASGERVFDTALISRQLKCSRERAQGVRFFKGAFVLLKLNLCS